MPKIPYYNGEPGIAHVAEVDLRGFAHSTSDEAFYEHRSTGDACVLDLSLETSAGYAARFIYSSIGKPFGSLKRSST